MIMGKLIAGYLADILGRRLMYVIGGLGMAWKSLLFDRTLTIVSATTAVQDTAGEFMRSKKMLSLRFFETFASLREPCYPARTQWRTPVSRRDAKVSEGRKEFTSGISSRRTLNYGRLIKIWPMRPGDGPHL